MEQEQRLGILGGMGPQATQVFYQRILDKTDASRDQEHVPTLIWSDTGMPDRTRAILSGETEPVFARLLSGARLLEREGCTVLAIPCNTSHFFADRLQAGLRVRLLNMVRLSAAAMAARGCRRVGILATDGTVRTGIYQRECAGQGVEAVVPGPQAQAIDRDLRSRGCDGAILACTELSVYKEYHGVSELYLDAMDVLAEESIRACGYPLRSV